MPFPPIPVPYNPHHPYNPSYPFILGNEYVPIKEELIQFLPEPSVEYGYRFRYEGYEWAKDQDGNDTLVGGFPNQLVGVYDLLKQPQFWKQKWALNMYPPGGEYAQGPVRSITIPVATFPATGTTALAGTDTFNGRDPTPLFTYHYAQIIGSTLAAADFSFDLTGYRSLLKGKRILDISLLYAGAVRDYAPEVTGLGTGIYRQVPVTYDPQFRQYNYEPLTMVGFQKAYTPPLNFMDFDIAYLTDTGARGWGSMPDLIFQSSDDNAIPPDELPIGTLSLGNSNKGTTTSITTWDDFGEYTYDMLESLHPAYPLTARMVLRMFVQLPNTAAATAGQYPRMVMNYIGLKITYCEESRLAYGEVDLSLLNSSGNPGVGRPPRPVGFINSPVDSVNWGFNGTTMVRSSVFTPGALPKGNYTVTVSPQNIGEDAGLRQRFHPLPLYATRQLYPTPMLDCLQIKVPYPVTSSANYDQTFEVEDSSLMPKMTLLPRFSGNPRHRYNSHVYSRQAQAPVYSDFKLSQRVVQFSQAITGMTNKQFPHVRFFARHFPGTNVPLTVQQDMDPGLVSTRFAPWSERWMYIGNTINDGGTGGSSAVKTTVASPIVTGDMEFRVDFTYFNWQEPQTDVFLFVTGTEGVFSYSQLSNPSVALMLNETITSPLRNVPFVSVVWWDSGGTAHAVPLNVPPTFLMDRGRMQLRAVFDIDNGAAGHTVNWYMANEIQTNWAFVGSTTVAGVASPRVPTAATSRYAIATPFSQNDGGLIIHSMQFYSGLTGTTLRSGVDFQHMATDTTSWTDDAGLSWGIAWNSDPDSNQGFTAPRIVAADAIPKASITPDEFDELEPLTTDGWAQVDLRLDPAYATNAFNPYLRWSARGEQAGCRWEVLAASAWEASGFIPANFIAQNPTGTTWSGDRGKYTGGTDGLVWQPQLGPFVTGSVVDYRTDVAFLLANDPPMVSGFGASAAVQALAYDTNCGLSPCGIATGLHYTALSWDLGDETAYIDSRFGKLKDTFERDESSGWGTPNYGSAYELLNATSSGLTYVESGVGGFIATSMAATGFVGVLSSSGNGPNMDMTFNVKQLNDLVRLENTAKVRAYGRYLDVWNYYWLNLAISPQITGTPLSVDDAVDQGLVLYLGKAVQGTEYTIDSRQLYPVPTAFGPNTGFNVRWMMDGTLIKVKVWPDQLDEPLLWNMEIEDTTITDAIYGGLVLDTPSGGPFGGPSATAYTLNASSLWPSGSSAVYQFEGNITIPPLAEMNDGNFAFAIIGIGDAGTPNSFGGMLSMVNAGGTDIRLRFYWSIDGNVVQSVDCSASISSILVPGSRMSFHAEIDSQFNVVRFAYSYDEYLPTANWTTIGTSQSTGADDHFWNSTGPVVVGTTSGGGNGAVLHTAQILGPSGQTIIYVDFDVVSPDSVSFVDDTGYTWQVAFPENILGPRYAEGVGFAAYHAEGRALFKFTEIEITPPRYWFGAHEIQRMDEEDTDWKTIMLASNPAITSFNDYEARVGITSWYRIRTVDKYDFTGPWSPVVSGMVVDPGVTGDCMDEGHLLIFTSNEAQDGSANLAYASVWEQGTVTEDFTFPDATVVQMQAMYNRDFYTAFRPMERAGEQFTRNMLVQAASVSPAVLANFTSLRNLSWEDLNYVAVRDEDGNRWLASISVPTGTVKRRRTLYIAPVNVVEVTDTPTPVDPEWAP